MADSRIVMNLKGIGIALIPRFFFQRLLPKIFDEILENSDQVLSEMSARVNYYNKINHSIKNEVLNSTEREQLGKLPFKKTSLAYDGYAISKYFQDNLLWIKKYGDINYCLTSPSICKDRPIKNSQENENNILLKLDKNRHFIYLNDTLSFSQKKDVCVFRGACYQALRQDFMRRHFATAKCDFGDTARNATLWKKLPVDKQKQIENKFILSIEGNTFASNLTWAMSSNSLVIAPKMTNETWFMEGTLKPNYHFALLDDDFNNLESLIEYYLSHQNEAQEIIANAHQYLTQFLDEKKEFHIGLLVLAKYLFLSEQIELPKGILEIIMR